MKKAKQGGHITEGICVNTKCIHGNRKSKSQYNKYDKLVVKYEYVVNGKKYYKKMRFQSPGCYSIEFPYKVEVYFDPKRPKKSCMPGGSNRSTSKGKRLSLNHFIHYSNDQNCIRTNKENYIIETKRSTKLGGDRYV